MNGMFLAFGCYFRANAKGLESIVDFVLSQRLDDGGFNCRANRSGARVSSAHSTTSVIDGLSEYLRSGYTHRSDEVREAIGTASSALLSRNLYQHRSSEEPIRTEFTRLHHPTRWRAEQMDHAASTSSFGLGLINRARPPSPLVTELPDKVAGDSIVNRLADNGTAIQIGNIDMRALTHVQNNEPDTKNRHPRCGPTPRLRRHGTNKS